VVSLVGGKDVVEDVGKAVEVPLPDRPVLGDPVLERAHRAGLEPAPPDAADLLRAHEAAALQHVEVLHHGRQRHVQRSGELAHGRRAARKADDHRAAALVGERVERGQRLARSGNTGFSTAPHLHFGVYRTDRERQTQSLAVSFDTRGGAVRQPRSGAHYLNRAD